MSDELTPSQKFWGKVSLIFFTVISHYIYGPIIMALCLVPFHFFHTFLWAQVPPGTGFLVYAVVGLGWAVVVAALLFVWYWAVAHISTSSMLHYPSELGIAVVQTALAGSALATILVYAGLFWVQGYWKAIPFLLALGALCWPSFRLSWWQIEFYLDLGKKKAANGDASSAPVT